MLMDNQSTSGTALPVSELLEVTLKEFASE
jgi:hypothetical protein